jgi:hypothetical protein
MRVSDENLGQIWRAVTGEVKLLLGCPQRQLCLT